VVTPTLGLIYLFPTTFDITVERQDIIMKILTKEEEQAHYNATVKGGIFGGTMGLVGGASGIYLLSRRYTTIAGLTLPMKAFLVTSTATFFSITSADRASSRFERQRTGAMMYIDRSQQELRAAEKQKTASTQTLDWLREHRYPIVFGAWVASMGAALAIVGRNKYLTTAQKLVQARVYAQGLTVAVLLGTATLELGDAQRGKGRWETVMVLDPEDPEHKHLIEKKIHHEAYAGEDLWRGMCSATKK
jgi:hypothetical protein